MKFKENLAWQVLSKENIDYADIQMYIEFSYVVGLILERNKDLKQKLDDLIMNGDSGIETYSFFVIFLYESYTISNASDYYNYITNNIEKVIDDFKYLYFE